jgi:hypothetical protein
MASEEYELHDVQNDLLLGVDRLILRDRGYITVTRNDRIGASRRLREEFGNGGYYKMHGRRLQVLPRTEEARSRAHRLARRARLRTLSWDWMRF